jgi:hypothetical protein
MNKHSLIKIGFVVMAVVSGFAFSACGNSSSSSSLPKELTAEEKKAKEGREALEAKKAEYTTIPAKEQLSKEPYRKKKLLFYRVDPDAAKDAKDPWISYFPSSVSNDANSKLEFKLAKSPDEVGTIALLQKCKEVKAGQYGSLATAYKEQCEMVLIDHALGAVVYREIFEGEPDDVKTISKGETSVTAKLDMIKVVDFLDRLRDKDDVSSAKTNTSPAKTDKK